MTFDYHLVPGGTDRPKPGLFLLFWGCLVLVAPVALRAQEVRTVEADQGPSASVKRVEAPEEKKAGKGLRKLGQMLFGSKESPVRDKAAEAGPEIEPEGVAAPDPGATSGTGSFKRSSQEVDGDLATEGIFDEVINQTKEFNAPELDHLKLESLPTVPHDFNAGWREQLLHPIWGDQTGHRYTLEKAYATALNHSTQIRAFLRIPKVQEAVIRENRGLFAPEIFAQGDAAHTDEPTGSILTTGETGRFLQDSLEGEYGVRKRLGTGGEMKLSQRLSTLDNNSQFLDPNPQSGSEVVLSVAQPLLRGSGTDYARSEVRLAELDFDLAEGESLRLLEEYLLEINRAYWGVYLSRAALAQRQKLTEQTERILKMLEERQKLDDTATVSELFRARATMNRRQADLRRTKMAVRTSEQRLRSMVRDPELPMGASGELIPVSDPAINVPSLEIADIAREALNNRAEMAQVTAKVRAAAVRRSQMLSEYKPQLDLVGELGYSGIAGGRALGGAMSDMTEHGTDWRLGLRYSIPWGNETAKARFDRRDLEYRQALDEYRIQGEAVLLDTVVSYQDLLTAYQDLAGKYQSALASRKEIEQLDDRMKLDDQDVGKTIAYQLQLLLDAVDRNQVAEEEFLVSVVAYNTAIAHLQRAQGVMLKVRSAAPTEPAPHPVPRQPGAAK